MVIRVLRLLEYVFDDAETAQRNMDLWTVHFKAPHMTMRSAQITDFNWIEVEVKDGGESDAPDLQGRQDG